MHELEQRVGLRGIEAGGEEEHAMNPVARGAVEPVFFPPAQIELGELFTLMNVPRVGQVHLYYRARLLSDRFNPGHETQEARLFTEAEIPWDEIAFRTVKETLEHYFADRKAGRFGIHTLDIT